MKSWKIGQTHEGLLGRTAWYLRQLMPMTYRSTYRDVDGKHFTVWRMWLGRCFDVDDVLVAE